MIKFIRAVDGREIYVSKPIPLIETPPDGAASGAILTVAGQKIAVKETVDDVIKALSAPDAPANKD